MRFPFAVVLGTFCAERAKMKEKKPAPGGRIGRGNSTMANTHNHTRAHNENNFSFIIKHPSVTFMLYFRCEKNKIKIKLKALRWFRT